MSSSASWQRNGDHVSPARLVLPTILQYRQVAVRVVLWLFSSPYEFAPHTLLCEHGLNQVDQDNTKVKLVFALRCFPNVFQIDNEPAHDNQYVLSLCSNTAAEAFLVQLGYGQVLEEAHRLKAHATNLDTNLDIPALFQHFQNQTQLTLQVPLPKFFVALA